MVPLLFWTRAVFAGPLVHFSIAEDTSVAMEGKVKLAKSIDLYTVP